MTLLRLTLGLAAAGLAAHFVHRARRQAALGGADGQASQALTDVQNAMGRAGQGAESPNTAERLQAEGMTGSPTAGAPMGDRDDMLSSTSQRGPHPDSTGLADYSRGG